MYYILAFIDQKHKKESHISKAMSLIEVCILKNEVEKENSFLEV